MIKIKILNIIKYYLMPSLQKWHLTKTNELSSDLKNKENSSYRGRVLIINNNSAILYYKLNALHNYKEFNTHALIHEVKILCEEFIKSGYIVDTLSCYENNKNIDWKKYKIVIDERDHLISIPNNLQIKKIFYCTGLLYSFQNSQELKRLESFYKRTGVLAEHTRQVLPIFSDKVADIITFYGKLENTKYFNKNAKRCQLNISVTHEIEIKLLDSRKEFIWMGSVGAIHKGLDLVVEAFKKMPNFKLNIFGNITGESIFHNWFQNQINAHPNIVYHGIADIGNSNTQDIFSNCIAHIFPSCSEGGPGSVAQTSFFGIIPIVTKTANVRSGYLGYEIEEDDPDKIIVEIIKLATLLSQLSIEEKNEKAKELKAFSLKYHTKEAYRTSVVDLIKLINS